MLRTHSHTIRRRVRRSRPDTARKCAQMGKPRQIPTTICACTLCVASIARTDFQRPIKHILSTRTQHISLMLTTTNGDRSTWSIAISSFLSSQSLSLYLSLSVPLLRPFRTNILRAMIINLQWINGRIRKRRWKKMDLSHEQCKICEQVERNCEAHMYESRHARTCDDAEMTRKRIEQNGVNRILSRQILHAAGHPPFNLCALMCATFM